MRNIVREGTVAAVSKDKVRVQIGKNTTDWLRWSTLRAGAVKISFRPSIGEPCTVVSENGNLNAGKVYPGGYSDANPMPDDCGDNDFIIDVPAGGRLVLRCGNASIILTENHIGIKAPRIDLDKN